MKPLHWINLVVVLFAAIVAAYTYAHVPIWVWCAGLGWFLLCVLILRFFAVGLGPLPDKIYDYGRCNGRLARRHKRSGQVEFLLKPSESGIQYDLTEPQWFLFHPSYWSSFIPASTSRATTHATGRRPAGRLESARTS